MTYAFVLPVEWAGAVSGWDAEILFG
jgi:hypothetical protein